MANTGKAIKDASEVFYNTFLGLKDDKRRDARDAEESRWRRVSEELANRQELRLAKESSDRGELHDVNMQAGQLKIQELEKAIGENDVFFEQYGMSLNQMKANGQAVELQDAEAMHELVMGDRRLSNELKQAQISYYGQLGAAAGARASGGGGGGGGRPAPSALAGAWEQAQDQLVAATKARDGARVKGEFGGFEPGPQLIEDNYVDALLRFQQVDAAYRKEQAGVLGIPEDAVPPPGGPQGGPGSSGDEDLGDDLITNSAPELRGTSLAESLGKPAPAPKSHVVVHPVDKTMVAADVEQVRVWKKKWPSLIVLTGEGFAGKGESQVPRKWLGKPYEDYLSSQGGRLSPGGVRAMGELDKPGEGFGGTFGL